jgi:hypothetical protein
MCASWIKRFLNRNCYFKTLDEAKQYCGKNEGVFYTYDKGWYIRKKGWFLRMTRVCNRWYLW